jgi:hypothetical protein
MQNMDDHLVGEFEGRQFSFRLNGDAVVVKNWHRAFKFYTVYLSVIRISVVSKKRQPTVARDMLIDLFNNHTVDQQYEFHDGTDIESFRLYDMRWVSLLVWGGVADQEVYLLKIKEEFFSLVINGLTINVGPACVTMILFIIGMATSNAALTTVIIVFWVINAMLAITIDKFLFIESRVMKQSFAGFQPRSSMVEYFVTQPKIADFLKGK